jgi:hypothetical protein
MMPPAWRSDSTRMGLLPCGGWRDGAARACGAGSTQPPPTRTPPAWTSLWMCMGPNSWVGVGAGRRGRRGGGAAVGRGALSGSVAEDDAASLDVRLDAHGGLPVKGGGTVLRDGGLRGGTGRAAAQLPLMMPPAVTSLSMRMVRTPGGGGRGRRGRRGGGAAVARGAQRLSRRRRCRRPGRRTRRAWGYSRVRVGVAAGRGAGPRVQRALGPAVLRALRRALRRALPDCGGLAQPPAAPRGGTAPWSGRWRDGRTSPPGAPAATRVG